MLPLKNKELILRMSPYCESFAQRIRLTNSLPIIYIMLD